MERRICPNCGTPQQWELWQHCACGYDFGPPQSQKKVESSPPNEAQERPSYLSRKSPEQAIRSIRMRILGVWAALLCGGAFSYWLVIGLHWAPGWSTSLIFAPFFLLSHRLRFMAPALPSLPLSGAIVICASAIFLAFASVYLPRESWDYIFPAVGLLIFSMIIAPDIRTYRAPLRFVAVENHTRLRPS